MSRAGFTWRGVLDTFQFLNKHSVNLPHIFNEIQRVFRAKRAGLYQGRRQKTFQGRTNGKKTEK